MINDPEKMSILFVLAGIGILIVEVLVIFAVGVDAARQSTFVKLFVCVMSLLGVIAFSIGRALLNGQTFENTRELAIGVGGTLVFAVIYLVYTILT